MTNPLQGPMIGIDAGTGNLFYSGSYIELGISSATGTFGAPGAGLVYDQPDSSGTGLVYNQAGFDVDATIPSIDYVMPSGSPYEAFAAGYTISGVNSSGYNSVGGHTDIINPSLVDMSSGSRLGAVWSGVLNGDLQVSIAYTFNPGDHFFKTTVTLTNLSGEAMDDVRYAREMDPQNVADVTENTSTQNEVVANRPVDNASEVTATSPSGDAYFGRTGSTASVLYYTTDPLAQVADGLSVPGALDAFDPSLYAGQTAGTTDTGDSAIGISYDGGPLAAGASTSFSYYTALTNDPVAAVTAIQVASSAPVLDPASDSGAQGDNLTNVATPVITGSIGPVGDPVTLWDGPTSIGSSIVHADGTWSVTTDPLSDGAHSITAVFTDPSGDMTSMPLSLTIDTIAPNAPGDLSVTPGSDTGVSSNDGITSDTTPVITGTGTAGDTIALYDTDGVTQLGTTSVNSSGDWQTVISPLPEGPHLIIAKEADAAGNVSASSTPFSLTIDITPPAAPSNLALDPASDSGTPSDGVTNIITPTITGTGEAGDTVTLFVDAFTPAGTATVDADGHWSITSSALGNGRHSFSASETDPAGNPSTLSNPFSLTIDTVALPPIVGLDPSSDSGVPGDWVTNDAKPAFIGMAEAGATVTIADTTSGTTVTLGSVVADAGGNWSITLADPLGDGMRTLTATVTDAAGNASTATPYTVTIDTIAPDAPTGLALNPASDTGVSSSDGLTKDATPTITGTGTAGDTITLYDTDGVAQLGTAVIDINGNWSVTSATLSEGSHTLTAKETDLAGNVSTASGGLTLTIDTSEPAPAALLLDPASDTGVAGDGITSVATPTITGMGRAGDMVTLYDGATAVGTATVDGTGIWSVTADPLADGSHNLTATETDAAGNESLPTTALVVTIDTTAPAVPSLTLFVGSDTGNLGDDTTSNQTPTLTGTGEVGSTITIYDGSGTDAFLLGTAVVGGGGTWSFTLTDPLAAGAHDLTAKATDTAGNESLSPVYTLTIDIPPPPAEIGLSPDTDSGIAGDGVTNVRMPTLMGTAIPGSEVTLFDGTDSFATATADGEGNWSLAFNVPLLDGTYTITATATDAAGNISVASDPFTLTINTSLPAAPSSLTLDPGSDSGVPGDGVTKVTTPVITGAGTAGDTITVYDGSAALGTTTVDGDGNWSLTIAALANGDHALTATQTDAVGNISLASGALNFTVDATRPATATLALDQASDSGVRGDNITNIATPAIDGTGEADATVALFDGSTQIGTATVGSDGRWSVTASHLVDGTHNLTAVQTDVAGNASLASATLAVTIDTAAPAVTAALQDTGSQRLLSGSGDPNTAVTISENGTAVGFATAGADGSWQFDISILTPGSHALVASETDAAGNTGSSAAVPVEVANRFGVTNVTTSDSGTTYGADYSGPVSYLESEFIYAGSDNINVAASVANVFIHGGSGDDALAAYAGSNVLDGGTGSNWLVGANGADGGTDTFFVDGRNGQNTWDTVLNFHAGDMLTFWGFDPSSCTINWLDNQGAPGYLGATVKVDFANAGVSSLVTFAGLSSSEAHFQTSTGTVGGLQYLAVTLAS